ncbi:MAG: zinc-ribbon domain-containing protein, partial [Oscillospiraceae bacterium]|nr:zinc-ribbon domain-containing protein [Oscillospiraceae bacterium]
ACPECGAEYAVGVKFCSACGTRLPEPASAKPFCTGCGAEIAEGMRFCGNCGTRQDSLREESYYGTVLYHLRCGAEP